MIPNQSSIRLLILVFLGLAGCQTTQAKPSVAAILETQSTNNLVALEQAIGELLNSKPVKLADDAFTLGSSVIIERSLGIDSVGRFVNDRNLKAIDSFTLLLQSNTCSLKHDQSNKIIRLEEVKCTVSTKDNGSVD